jgi:hypothetical protein
MTGPVMPRRRRQFEAVSANTGDRLPSALSRVLDSAGKEAKGIVHGDYDRIAAISDPFDLLRAATERLADAQQEVTELARLRRRLIQDLHAQGMSYAQIGEAAGLTRGRIHQIRHTGPAPEGAFFGTGAVVIITPLKREELGGRPVVAVEDVTASARLEALARSFALDVTTEHVPLGGDIDLNRHGLIVICGPRLSEVMGRAYAADPVIGWEQIESGAWALRDTRSGELHVSPMDDGSGRNEDIAYLGRLPRPDGHGTFLAFTGVHPPGTLGVVALLASDLGTLWGQVGAEPFSVVISTDYDPDTHEPGKPRLVTPLYRHDQAPAEAKR